MKQKTERRLEDLECAAKTLSARVVTRIRETDGALLNMDGTPYVDEPLPPGTRVIEIVIVDPPNRPPFEPTVKPQVRH